MPSMLLKVMRRRFASCCCLLPLLISVCFAEPPAAATGLRVLFLGDNGHHRPYDRFRELEPVLSRHGIKVDYTTSLDDLSPAKLAGYDCLLIYANHTKISPSQEESLLNFVNHGGG